MLQRSSSLTIAERICGAFIPFIAVVEILVFTLSGCFKYRPQHKKRQFGFKDLASLADETNCKLLFLSFGDSGASKFYLCSSKCCFQPLFWFKRHLSFISYLLCSVLLYSAKYIECTALPPPSHAPHPSWDGTLTCHRTNNPVQCCSNIPPMIKLGHVTQ